MTGRGSTLQERCARRRCSLAGKVVDLSLCERYQPIETSEGGETCSLEDGVSGSSACLQAFLRWDSGRTMISTADSLPN
jgi:hypothetical protein